MDKELYSMLDGIEEELTLIKNEEHEDYYSISDWLDDQLEVEVTTQLNKNYIGSNVYITLGGPTVWLDTRYSRLEARWGGDQASINIDYSLVDELDQLIEEYINY